MPAESEDVRPGEAPDEEGEVSSSTDANWALVLKRQPVVSTIMNRLAPQTYPRQLWRLHPSADVLVPVSVGS